MMPPCDEWQAVITLRQLLSHSAGLTVHGFPGYHHVEVIPTFYKHQGMGAAIMVNSNDGQALLDEIERAIAREYEWPDFFSPDKQRIEVDAASLDLLAGEYETEAGLRIVMTRDGKDLLLRVGRQPTVRLAPSEPSRFFASNFDLEVVFKASGEQPAESLTLLQNQSTVAARRTTTEDRLRRD